MPKRIKKRAKFISFFCAQHIYVISCKIIFLYWLVKYFQIYCESVMRFIHFQITQVL